MLISDTSGNRREGYISTKLEGYLSGKGLLAVSDHGVRWKGQSTCGRGGGGWMSLPQEKQSTNMFYGSTSQASWLSTQSQPVKSSLWHTHFCPQTARKRFKYILAEFIGFCKVGYSCGTGGLGQGLEGGSAGGSGLGTTLVQVCPHLTGTVVHSGSLVLPHICTI